MVGDLHINIWEKNNKKFEHITETLDHLEQYIEIKEPDFLVIMGDLFDTKVMTSTEGLINITRRIDSFSSYCHVYIIVGNHDMASASDSTLNLPNIFENLPAPPFGRLFPSAPAAPAPPPPPA